VTYGKRNLRFRRENVLSFSKAKEVIKLSKYDEEEAMISSEFLR